MGPSLGLAVPCVRVSMGISWVIVLVAGYLGAQSGLNRIQFPSQAFFDTGHMVVVVLLFIDYAVALNALMVRMLYGPT